MDNAIITSNSCSSGVGESRGLPWEVLVWHSSHRYTNPQNNHWDQQEIPFLINGWSFSFLRVILSTLLHQCKLSCAPFLPQFFRFSPINLKTFDDKSSTLWTWPFSAAISFFFNKYLTREVIHGGSREDITILLTGKHLSMRLCSSLLNMLVAISTSRALIKDVQS